MNKLLNKKIIVDNYSIESASLYENNINKNFLYGQETKKFINNLTIKNKDKVIADIGCGTGYVFELINKKYKNNNIKFYGIDPAEGMLNIAKKKINDKKTLFKKGYFEKIPLKTNSVDKIISTFALHWVASIDKALKELKRITKNNCSIDILMVEKNDGKEFKKIVFKIMKKYLSKKQIFNAANLINRLTKNELKKKISYHFNLKNEYSLFLKKKEKIVYGSCNDHLKWWKARSLQFISEVKNKKIFIEDLKEELNKYKDKKIPFDLSLLEIHIVKE